MRVSPGTPTEVILPWMKIRKSFFAKEATWIPLRELALGNSGQEDTLAFKEPSSGQSMESYQGMFNFSAIQ